MNLGTETFGKNITKVEIVISFEINQTAAMDNQTFQRIKHGIELTERV